MTAAKRGIQAQHAQKLSDILDRLNAAHSVADMKYPGSDLHQLKGKIKGLWAVKVSGNWRVETGLKPVSTSKKVMPTMLII